MDLVHPDLDRKVQQTRDLQKQVHDIHAKSCGRLCMQGIMVVVTRTSG